MTWTRIARPVQLFALCLVSISTSHSPSRAAERAPLRVSLDLTDCDASFSTEVRRIASVELHATVVDPTEHDGVVALAFVTCREALADLWVSDAVTSKLVARTVSLAGTAPRARARLIALAVAELVSASWEEVESNPEPKVPAATPGLPEARAAVRRAIEGPVRITVDAVADTRVLVSSRAFVFGGGARSTIRMVRALTLRFGADTAVGNVSRSLGDVSLDLVAGAAGLGWAFDGGPLHALLWIGARAGYARLTGATTAGASGHVVSGPWAGPEGGVDLIVWPHSLVHLTLGLSGGAAVVGELGKITTASGAESDDVVVPGAWGELAIGLGIAKW